MSELIMTDNQEMPFGFLEKYEVTLYFEEQPTLKGEALLNGIKNRLGKAVLLTEEAGTISFELEDYTLTDSEEKVAFDVKLTDIGPIPAVFEKYASQSWSWPEASDLTGRINYQLTLSDRIGYGLPPKERVVLFQVALYCLTEYTGPIGIQWHASHQLIDPAVYLGNVPGDEDYDLLFGPLNVRLYSVKDTEDDTVMDTVGMAALGIVDIQCCFYGFDKEAMADLLYHYGTYVFWNGDVIKEGQTIEGINPVEKWGVRHELSQLEPRRPVINIGPDIKL